LYVYVEKLGNEALVPIKRPDHRILVRDYFGHVFEVLATTATNTDPL